LAIKKTTKSTKPDKEKAAKASYSKFSEDDEKRRIDRWKARLSDGNRTFDRWYDDFKVAKSRRYYKGFARTGDDRLDSHNQERVQINLIAPTINTLLPNLYFYFPFIRVLGTPAVTAQDNTSIEDQAQLLQDTGNTIIRDQATGFNRETFMALKESMWAFGVIEIGYTANFVDNPSYEKRPGLIEDEAAEEVFEDESKPKDFEPEPRGIPDDSLKSLQKLVDKEHFFVRHIPPETFRVSISGQPHLEANDWCGYFEWMYIEDVKKATAYRKEATEDLEPGGSIVTDYSSGTGDVSTSSSTAITYPTDSTQDRDRDRSGQIKVWRIWDLRQRVKHVFAEGCDKFFIEGEPYRDLPIFPLSFDEQDDDWYPIPPIFPMLVPQEEYNDSREMLRGLRKIIYPRFVADGGIDPDELRKLEAGGSGVIARVQQANPCPVVPLQQLPFDAQIVRTIATAKDEIMQVSGVSNEARGQVDSDTTATQASIVNQRAMVRDSFSRLRVAKWLSNICRGLIRLAIDKMTLPMWILRNCDSQSPSLIQTAMGISDLYRKITYTDLSEADQLLSWDVSIDVETLSPLTEDLMRGQITSLITQLAQPPVAMLLQHSPPLHKTFLDRSDAAGGAVTGRWTWGWTASCA
jgi:hypothetical protein